MNKDLSELEKMYKEIHDKLETTYGGEIGKLRTDLKVERTEKESLQIKVRE